MHYGKWMAIYGAAIEYIAARGPKSSIPMVNNAFFRWLQDLYDFVKSTVYVHKRTMSVMWEQLEEFLAYSPRPIGVCSLFRGMWMGSVPVSLEQLTRQILHTVLEAGVMVDAQIYSSVFPSLFSCIVFIFGVCCVCLAYYWEWRGKFLGDIHCRITEMFADMKTNMF